MKFIFEKEKNAYTLYASGVILSTSYIFFRMSFFNGIWGILILLVLGYFIFMELKRFQQLIEFDFKKNIFDIEKFYPRHSSCLLDR